MAKKEKELTKQERWHLEAARRDMERSENPERREAAKVLDKLSPGSQRAVINLFHLSLDDPRAFLLLRKFMRLGQPLLTAWYFVTGHTRRKRKANRP